MTDRAVTVPAPPKTPLTRSLLYYFGWFAFLALLIWSWEGADMRPGDLIRYSHNMWIFAEGFLSPDFRQWQLYLEEMLITLQIAVWGTVLAVVFSIPFGILSSSNLTPWYIVQPVRRLMDAFRAINEMVFAMLFVVAVGLGPFAGVLALFVHTTGILAKLFSEAAEAIDPRPVEGIRATGANWLQEIAFGVIPQVVPLWISYSLYRFESNVRSATVIGIVGAGGIGATLSTALDRYEYDSAAAILLLIIAIVLATEYSSSWARRWLQ